MRKKPIANKEISKLWHSYKTAPLLFFNSVLIQLCNEPLRTPHCTTETQRWVRTNSWGSGIHSPSYEVNMPARDCKQGKNRWGSHRLSVGRGLGRGSQRSIAWAKIWRSCSSSKAKHRTACANVKGVSSILGTVRNPAGWQPRPV